MRIDLNSDLGEAFGAWPMGQDGLLMPVISSANVACGFHAGDPCTIRQTIRLARKHGVAVGAHPGLPDLIGFGRREMQVSPAEVEDMVLYQVGALAAIARSEGVPLQHVKAHGALYNMACRDEALRCERKLIETLAEDLCRLLLQRWPLALVRVRLHKFILPDTRAVSVTLTRQPADFAAATS